VYDAPDGVGVGDVVVLPGSWFDREQQLGTVVSLDAGTYDGPVKSIVRVQGMNA
jgi:hypothetical protein